MVTMCTCAHLVIETVSCMCLEWLAANSEPSAKTSVMNIQATYIMYVSKCSLVNASLVIREVTCG